MSDPAEQTYACTSVHASPHTASEVRALAALLEVSFEAKLVHRRFAPLYVNGAFTALFGFASVADALSMETICGLIDPAARADPLRAWGSHLCTGVMRGERWMRRRDGRPIRTRFSARPILWRGDAAMAIAMLEQPAAPRRVKSARDVLAISADDGVLRRLRLFLATLSCDVDCAADLDEAAARSARKRYDLILADLDLPNQEGWSAARRLRALPAPFGAGAILAMAPPTGPPPLDDIAAAGMDGMVGKPLAPSELERAIALLSRSIEPAELDDVE